MSGTVAAQRPGMADEVADARAEPMPPLWLTVPARPGQLPGLRRALRQWLRLAGVDEDDVTAVLVAVGEATSNAVEHAYVGAEPGLVRLTAGLGPDGVLTLRVIDSGRWLSQESGENRGRGLPLMRATMDDVEVRGADDGTTVLMRLTLSHGGDG